MEQGALRLFIGVPLPDAYQQGLAVLHADWGRRLASRLSWTREGNWHLTLKFLGKVAREDVEPLKQVLAAIEWRAFLLQAAGGGFFPPPRSDGRVRPRVVWCGLVKGASECVRLAGAVDRSLAALGFPREERAFRPHLTLARVKNALPADAKGGRWTALLRDLQARAWPEITVDRFVLWQSTLRPSGPEYTALGEYAATA